MRGRSTSHRHVDESPAEVRCVRLFIMAQAFDAQPPPLEDENGVIRIVGTRVQLETIVSAFELGATPEELVQNYPTLELPAVYSILAYVLQNTERVSTYMARRRAEADVLKAEIQQRFPSLGFRQRMLERRAHAKG